MATVLETNEFGWLYSFDAIVEYVMKTTQNFEWFSIINVRDFSIFVLFFISKSHKKITRNICVV
jgi:hypothetical protein